jgi:hypothetical protein
MYFYVPAMSVTCILHVDEASRSFCITSNFRTFRCGIRLRMLKLQEQSLKYRPLASVHKMFPALRSLWQNTTSRAKSLPGRMSRKCVHWCAINSTPRLCASLIMSVCAFVSHQLVVHAFESIPMCVPRGRPVIAYGNESMTPV